MLKTINQEVINELRKAIRTALNGLGEPGPDYPANVVNAVDILKRVLNGR